MANLSRLLDQPEYVHAAINHFPLIGVLIAMLAVLAGLIARSRAATCIGLFLLTATALSVWPVFHFGEAGYDRVLSMSDDAGQAFLQYHQQLADRWVFLYYLTAGVAGLTCALSWKWPRLMLPGSILALLLAAGSLVAGIYIAQAGGEVRHREFRMGPPPKVKQENGS
jgi:hypothetical protein